MIFSFLLYPPLPVFCFSQVSDAEIALLRRLDSVQQTNSIAKHFASIYSETTRNAVDFFYKADEPVRHFIQRFETRFADYYFRSVQACEKKDTISSNWRAYYSETSLSDIQYKLLGAIAHINGDIWRTLTTEFTPAEIRKYKQAFFKLPEGVEENLFLRLFGSFQIQFKNQVAEYFNFWPG